MYQQFKTKAEAVGAEVHRHATRQEALGFVLSLLAQEGVADRPGQYAVWAAGTFLEGLDRQELEGVAGVKLTVTKELASTAKFGISQLEWALADTGSLAQDASGIEQRLVSTLSTVHIALVPSMGLLPDLPSLLERLTPASSAYMALITGPSRTADIERVLTIGVHGPKRLVIVFVDELGGAG